ncbi:MAG TPA: class I SAM-dependent methyltransferase [Saprospiraceae bacterium]|nr:class I SAM-dependent methyltransferase [Saprospiraceae bacterium]
MESKEIIVTSTILNIFDNVAEKYLTRATKVLEIGFGSGIHLYRLFHKYGIEKFLGIEKEEGLNSNFYQHSPITSKKLYHEFQNPEYDSFYKVYKKYLLDELDLSTKSLLTELDFIDTFESKFKLKTDFLKYNLIDEKYDFIIASKVLHYIDIESQRKFIEKCISLLSDKAFLFLSFYTKTTNGISMERFKTILENFPTIETFINIEFNLDESENSLIVFVGNSIDYFNGEGDNSY